MSIYLMLGDKCIELTEVSEEEGNVMCAIVDNMWAAVIKEAVDRNYKELEKNYEKLRKKEGIQEDSGE